MKRSIALVGACACAAALVCAGTTAASPAATIKIKLGDSIDLKGTHVYCQTLVGSGVFKGKKLVACYKLAGGKPVVGSYTPALAVDGDIAVAKATKTSATVVFRRKPARAGAEKPRVVQAKVGDTLELSGTDIACGVNKSTNGVPYITCFKYSQKGGKTGTYSFAISDFVVAITQFTAPNKSKVVKTWNHPA